MRILLLKCISYLHTLHSIWTVCVLVGLLSLLLSQTFVCNISTINHKGLLPTHWYTYCRLWYIFGAQCCLPKTPWLYKKLCQSRWTVNRVRPTCHIIFTTNATKAQCSWRYIKFCILKGLTWLAHLPTYGYQIQSWQGAGWYGSLVFIKVNFKG